MSQPPATMRAIILPPSSIPSTSPTSTSVAPIPTTTPHITGSSLLLTTLPTPTPPPGHHLILTHAVALTPYELTWDITYKLPAPRIPCQDISGTVITSSSSTSPFQPGDRVLALIPLIGQGGLAEYCICEEKYLARVPDGMSFVEAASLPRAGLTALQAVRKALKGRDERSERVLITGATGAVGRIVVQILRYMLGEQGKDGSDVEKKTRTRIIALGGTGSESLLTLGADTVINYKTHPNWATDLPQSEGPIDLIIDILGPPTLTPCFSLIRSGGRLLTVGSPRPEWENVRGWKEAKERDVEAGFHMVEESGAELSEVVGLVESGWVKTSVSTVVDGLSKEGVREAWMRAEKGGMAGTVVVKVREE